MKKQGLNLFYYCVFFLQARVAWASYEDDVKPLGERGTVLGEFPWGTPAPNVRTTEAKNTQTVFATTPAPT